MMKEKLRFAFACMFHEQILHFLWLLKVLKWFKIFGKDDLETFDLRKDEFLRLLRAIYSLKMAMRSIITELQAKIQEASQMMQATEMVMHDLIEQKTCDVLEMKQQLYEMEANVQEHEMTDVDETCVDLTEDEETEDEKRESDEDWIEDDTFAMPAVDEEFLPPSASEISEDETLSPFETESSEDETLSPFRTEISPDKTLSSSTTKLSRDGTLLTETEDDTRFIEEAKKNILPGDMII